MVTEDALLTEFERNRGIDIANFGEVSGGSGESGNGGEVGANNGFSGASDDTSELCCPMIFISDIQENSIAANDNRLRVGDQILQINGQFMKCREQAEKVLIEQNIVTLLISRYLYAGHDFQVTTFAEKEMAAREHVDVDIDDEDEDEDIEEEEDDCDNEDVDDDDDEDEDENNCENEEAILNYENFLHDQAYINLVNSLDKSLILNASTVIKEKNLEILDRKEDVQQLQQKEISLTKKTSSKILLNEKEIMQKAIKTEIEQKQKSAIFCSDEESEHIYETIPEDSETEPLYCSPYESSQRLLMQTTTPFAVVGNLTTSTAASTGTKSTTGNTVAMKQMQLQLQKKKQQRVAQWLGMTTKQQPYQQQQQQQSQQEPQQHQQQQSFRHIFYPNLLTNTHRPQFDDHENSSSAYNTGGSNASIPLLNTTTTAATTTTNATTPATTTLIKSINTNKLSSPKHNNAAATAWKTSTRKDISISGLRT